MKSHTTRSLAFFFLFFAFGAWLIYSSPHFHPSTFTASREPSAIKSLYDFSNLQGHALESASKQRLLNGLSVVKNDAWVGVELGHFVFKNNQGTKQFACDHYSRVSLIFEGDGMAVGGMKPLMTVDGPCEISSDINHIAPIWIPAGRLLEEPASDGEYDFTEKQNIRLSFKNIADSWPTLWKLQSVKLISKEPSSEIYINEKDLLINEPIMVSFIDRP